MVDLSRRSTAPQLLAGLVEDDPGQPRITWYDDEPGPTSGERIELSARVLSTWVAKAANLLADELSVQRGDVVRLDLPVHWRALYWALAAWRVGAVVTLDDDPAADVLVTDRPAEGVAAQQVAVSLPALARSWTPTGRAPLQPPPGVLDEAADLATYPDVFEPYDDPEGGDDALRTGGLTRTAAQLVADAWALTTAQGWPPRARVLVSDERLDDVLVAVLAAWSGGGSVVLVRGAGEPDVTARRRDAERVTSAYDPPGRPASRS